MIAIYKDKTLRDLGFRQLYVIHDEIAGQCPKENIEAVAQRLKECMIESAKSLCSVPMKVDTYVLNHWYFDDLSDVIEGDYNKLLKEKSEEEAFKIIIDQNPEIKIETLRKICNGTVDLINDELV